MLNDEERKALEILNNTEWDGFMITIKNLIEKQSKEIEELKDIVETLRKENVSLYIERKQKENKIKAKIEEINEKSFKNDINYSEFYYKKEVLQSLLEKE